MPAAASIRKTSTRKAGDKETEALKLNRHDGNALYIECLQLVLRKQTWWMVKHQKVPENYESVVQDLWDLRIRRLRVLQPPGDLDGAATATDTSAADTTSY